MMDEIENSILTLTHEEIGVEQYISEEERSRVSAEPERKCLLRGPGKKKDDAGGSCVEPNDGRNGTLEKKNNLEDEVASFGAKVKAMEGQREATRKSLNLDLRKFKTEVANIIKHLDERVQKMFRLTEGRHSGTCMCPEVGRLHQ